MLDVVIHHKSDIKAATSSFMLNIYKHPQFPNSLVRNLLEAKYIDLTKLHGSVMSLGSSDKKFLEVNGSSSSIELSSQTVSKPFTSSSKFFTTLNIPKSTLCIAFRQNIPQFESYFSHIFALVHTPGNACHWRDVALYNAKI